LRVVINELGFGRRANTALRTNPEAILSGLEGASLRETRAALRMTSFSSEFISVGHFRYVNCEAGFGQQRHQFEYFEAVAGDFGLAVDSGLDV